MGRQKGQGKYTRECPPGRATSTCSSGMRYTGKCGKPRVAGVRWSSLKKQWIKPVMHRCEPKKKRKRAITFGKGTKRTDGSKPGRMARGGWWPDS